MQRFLLCLASIVLLADTAFGGDLPEFHSDRAADQWLRDSSPTYHKIAEIMDQSGGYSIVRTQDFPRSIMMLENDQRMIKLNDDLHGATRVTLMLFEFANASQKDKFKEIAAAVQSGDVRDASEYAILHMLIEMESLHLHRQVLLELDQTMKGVPPEMFQCFKPEATALSAYELPSAYDYIKGRQGSSYRQYYEQWFREHVLATDKASKKN